MEDAAGSLSGEPLFTARLAPARRAAGIVLYSAATLVNLGLMAYCGSASDAGPGTRLGLAALFAVGAAGCALMLTECAFRSTIFYRDRVVQTGLFGSRTLARDEIKGCYRTGGSDDPQIEIAPRDETVRSIFVDRSLMNSNEAKLWLAGLPDLGDAE